NPKPPCSPPLFPEPHRRRPWRRRSRRRTWRARSSPTSTPTARSPTRAPSPPIKRLRAFHIIESTDITREAWVLTDEAKGYAAGGSREVHLVAAIPPEGASRAALKEEFGDVVFDIARKAAAKNKWIRFERGIVLRTVEDTTDEMQELLKRVENGEDEVQEQLKRLEKGKVVPDLIKELKRRKLVTKEKVIWYSLKKGPEFVVKRKTLATDVTREHLKSGDWKDLEFKDYNYEAQGQPIAIGYSQPLLEVSVKQSRTFFLRWGSVRCLQTCL
uniref:phenylalanine--tRNA ligase n=1 Tax=Aegilops tauschii subsp. strangulata TaxID=200361 RepID=A0A453PNK2_AEGTS